MFGAFLICFLPIVLFTLWRWLPAESRDARVFFIVIIAYAARLAAANFVHEFNLFSYGNAAGSDAGGYEVTAGVLNRLWDFTGVHYVTTEELPWLADTTLPANLFALIQHLNGEPTHLGCVALTATAGCITALNIYALAHELGCAHRSALRVLTIVAFLPTFFFYTADMYKDGLVTCFVFGALGSAIRLSRRFTLAHLLLGFGSLAALWATRFYLVFVMVMPFAAGLLGVRSKSFGRTTAMALLLTVAGLVLVVSSHTLSVATERANSVYSFGTSDAVLRGNAGGESGVLVSGSGPAAFAIKLAYALFSPFPWQSGSLGLQLAKFEMVFWYYFFFRAVRSIRRIWFEHRADFLLFAMFIVPTIITYTVSFSNIGLVVRERLSVVLGFILLSGLNWRKEATARQPEAVAAVVPIT
jgi:hypothetical protein